MKSHTKCKTILTLLICLLLNTQTILACECPRITIEQAIDQSSNIFSGEVVGFEYRKDLPNQSLDEQAKKTGEVIEYETLVVKVKVDLWWKGEPTKIIYLLTSETRNSDGTNSVSSCDYKLHKGETYLIFATRYNTKRDNEYRTSDCLGTKKLLAAEDDLKILGEGKKVKESNEESNISNVVFTDTESNYGDDKIYLKDEVDTPALIKKIKVHPKFMNGCAYGGTIKFTMVLHKSGKVTDIHIENKYDCANFQKEKIIDSLKKVKFTPAIKDGVTVSQWSIGFIQLNPA